MTGKSSKRRSTLIDPIFIAYKPLYYKATKYEGQGEAVTAYFLNGDM